jgi:hypothetical protein
VSEFLIEISLSPLETEGETLVSSAIRDISGRKKAEEKFKDLLESAPDAMVIVRRNLAKPIEVDQRAAVVAEQLLRGPR